jgi:hypothetical protein
VNTRAVTTLSRPVHGNFEQSNVIHFRVNGDGVERPMAEQIRNRLDRLTSPEQSRGERVPECMRTLWWQPEAFHPRVHDHRDRTRSKPQEWRPLAKKNGVAVACRPFLPQVLGQGLRHACRQDVLDRLAALVRCKVDCPLAPVNVCKLER